MEDVWLENIPQYDLYEDEAQNEQTFPQQAEELEPMPEVTDYYIGAEILLSIGEQMATGHVLAWSYDANGNVMGRAHVNPILDTRIYQVELADGEVTELSANIIAELMYT